MFVLVEEQSGKLMEQANDLLEAKKVETARIHSDAPQTHKPLLESLDLEQKAASLGEARVTSKQGQAVMLFTIITIIFLPLSLFTSYFGQNVVEFTGDEKNPTASEVWKVRAPISVVVIVVALIIAFFIMSSWKRKAHEYDFMETGAMVEKIAKFYYNITC
ncbi:hypothetical protein INS49_003297 [Diaporthe citri]|uniref:uncharacterized protein n=1 Tax=Diaporthe citri TaxID=83186 RepID=UPI001C82640C|nr:uncharacterized protein INS49_003297 [Diaporthe citri]KAG6355336.1 hypothetical protein INS49_003297 [Diaporthe citri]